MRTQKILAVLAAVVSVNLISCVSASKLADGSIEGVKNTRWSLVTLSNQAIVADSTVTINFDSDKVTGTDGCNQYNALYTLLDDKLNISRSIATTSMACPDPIMKQATDYKNLLSQAMSYKIEDAQLMLLDTEKNTLATFKKQSAELTGTSWLIMAINNGKQAVTSLINDSTLTISFGVDGNLSGFAGCNNYNASYELAGKTIKIGTIAATRKACDNPTGVMEQEAQFLAALETATTYQVEGKKLELRTIDNALAVTLVAP